MSVGWVGFVERILTKAAKQFCRMSQQIFNLLLPILKPINYSLLFNIIFLARRLLQIKSANCIRLSFLIIYELI